MLACRQSFHIYSAPYHNAKQHQAVENEVCHFHIIAAGVYHLDMQRHAFQCPALTKGLNQNTD